MRTNKIIGGILGLGMVVAVMGLVSPAQATLVLWYGKNCADETGGILGNGAVVQLIRSPDAAIGAPDPVTGAPTGNDVVCAETGYIFPGAPEDNFKGKDWNESSDYYVCVRIWNAGDAASGTYYWDSAVSRASGMFPVDIDCIGAKTGKQK